MVTIGTSLIDTRPTLPCPTPQCPGRLYELHDRDAFGCQHCGYELTWTALTRMVTATIDPRLLYAALNGRRQDTLTIIMGAMLEDAKKRQAGAQEEYQWHRYLHDMQTGFMDAVEALADARGYIFQSGPPQPSVPSPYKGGMLPTTHYGPVTGMTEQKDQFLEAEAVPTSNEPVRGWRAWKIHPRRRGPKQGEPILRSITYGTQWLPKVTFHGRCNLAWHKNNSQWRSKLEREGVHVAPVRDCQCGIYAKTSARGASRWAASPTSYASYYGAASGTGAGYPHGTLIPVVGMVQLWGRVLLYTEGFRGEYAYPYHLFIPAHFTPLQEERWGSSEQIAKQLRSAYACDVEAVEFNPPDPPPGYERNPYG